MPSDKPRSRPTPLIDSLIPGRRVHLLGGPSGAGKSTWLLQTLETWRRGEPIHGYASHPVPFVYLSYDRDDDDFIDTCERLKIDPSTYNFIAPSHHELDIPLLTQLKELKKRYPTTGLFVIEGIAVNTPNGKINDQQVVGKWLRRLQEFCKENDCTIIGVLHSAKTKERDSYKDPRAKIAGCGAWAGYSSTVIIIEEQEPDSSNELRTLSILPRNAKKHFFTLDFSKEGRLVEISKTKPIRERITEWLPQSPDQFTVEQVMAAIAGARSSVFFELADLEKKSVIRKVGHGIYAFTRPTTTT